MYVRIVILAEAAEGARQYGDFVPAPSEALDGIPAQAFVTSDRRGWIEGGEGEDLHEASGIECLRMASREALLVNYWYHLPVGHALAGMRHGELHFPAPPDAVESE